MILDARALTPQDKVEAIVATERRGLLTELMLAFCWTCPMQRVKVKVKVARQFGHRSRGQPGFRIWSRPLWPTSQPLPSFSGIERQCGKEAGGKIVARLNWVVASSVCVYSANLRRTTARRLGAIALVPFYTSWPVSMGAPALVPVVTRLRPVTAGAHPPS